MAGGATQAFVEHFASTRICNHQRGGLAPFSNTLTFGATTAGPWNDDAHLLISQCSTWFVLREKPDASTLDAASHLTSSEGVLECRTKWGRNRLDATRRDSPLASADYLEESVNRDRTQPTADMATLDQHRAAMDVLPMRDYRCAASDVSHFEFISFRCVTTITEACAARLQDRP